MNNNTLVVGVAAFIIGALSPWMLHSLGMYGGGCGMGDGMGGTMNSGMHRMADGTMMQGGMDTGMGSMMMDMTAGLKGKTGKDLEKAFITEMIPHHQGAVDMAKMLLADPTVSTMMKQFGTAIITAQEGEIKSMQEWLKNY